MPVSAAAALIAFGASLVVRALTLPDDGSATALGWTVVQAIGFIAAVLLALGAVRAWRASNTVWDERLHHRLLLAASSGFATMLALGGTILVAAPLLVLTQVAVAYLQVGVGILTLGVVLWEREGD